MDKKITYLAFYAGGFIVGWFAWPVIKKHYGKGETS